MRAYQPVVGRPPPQDPSYENIEYRMPNPELAILDSTDRASTPPNTGVTRQIHNYGDRIALSSNLSTLAIVPPFCEIYFKSSDRSPPTALGRLDTIHRNTRRS